MRKLFKVAVALSAVSVLWTQSIQAQEQEVKAGQVEFFACNFMKGKSMKDLDKVADAFGVWTKENGSNYSAWILTPQFHNEPGMFDVGWLGGWPDGKAFGKAQDAWMAGGGKLAADFAKVMDCSVSHQLASSVELGGAGEVPGDGVVMFSECSLNEGKTMADSYQAHMTMGAAMRERGSKLRAFLFYPSLGAGDIDFDYWQVLSAQNYTDLGAALENYTNGGGYQKSQETLGPVISCKSPTVYDAHQVVAGSNG